MKIEEINNLVTQMWNITIDIPQFEHALNEARFDRLRDKMTEIKDALSRLRPTTITADPATWPPEGERIVAYLQSGKAFVCIRQGTGLMFTHGNVDYYIARLDHQYTDNAVAWQYLPEWEG